jgi:hypothetical protein
MTEPPRASVIATAALVDAAVAVALVRRRSRTSAVDA